MNILRAVRNTISRYDLIKKGNTILVACSGGVDSIALLYILLEIKAVIGIANIWVAHLDHRIRENSRKDADFVRKTCDDIGIPCVIHSVDVPGFAKENSLSLEDAARRIRYKFLEEKREELQLDLIATGHTLNDQIETFFLRIDRGTGLKGLSLIPPKRDKIIRPLICTYRNEILRFLSGRSIPYRMDESNLDLSIKRNLIRHKLVPHLLDTLPDFGEKLIRLRDTLEADEEVIESLVDKIWDEVVEIE
jgi:tRNA(Ile)-lysidine synthase